MYVQATALHPQRSFSDYSDRVRSTQVENLQYGSRDPTALVEWYTGVTGNAKVRISRCEGRPAVPAASVSLKNSVVYVFARPLCENRGGSAELMLEICRRAVLDASPLDRAPRRAQGGSPTGWRFRSRSSSSSIADPNELAPPALGPRDWVQLMSYSPVEMWSDRAVYLARSCRLSVSRYLSVVKTSVRDVVHFTFRRNERFPCNAGRDHYAA